MKELFEVDELQQYCGMGLDICKGLSVLQPTVGDIVEVGEIEYFSMVYTLTAIPSDLIAQLDKAGVDWEKIEDFELFCMLAPSLKEDCTKVLFGDLSFPDFNIVPLEDQRGCILRNDQTGVVIDELRYKAITHYLCTMHHIKKQPRTAGNAFTHKMMVDMAYEDLKKNQIKKPQSMMKSLISTMVNMPGFKYNRSELMKVGFCEFMDSVSRIQMINSAQALLQGCYAGNVDMKKIDKSELNYMRDI